MKKGIRLTIFLFLSFTLSGCGGTPLTEEELEAGQYLDVVGNFKPFLTKVGDRKEVKYVKHIENDEYELAIMNENGSIDWIKVYKGDYIQLENKDYGKNKLIDIRYDENIKNSYIERIENSVDEYEIPKGKLWLTHYTYVLYVAENNLGGGTTERSCGKNCKRSIQTEIISD